jgi:hypothetical protein
MKKHNSPSDIFKEELHELIEKHSTEDTRIVGVNDDKLSTGEALSAMLVVASEIAGWLGDNHQQHSEKEQGR